MPPNNVAVTVARPNLPYSTASTHAGIQRLRMKALCVSVWSRRRVLHRVVVEPDVRDVKVREHTAGRGLPGDPEQDGLPAERFLSRCRPRAFVDQVLRCGCIRGRARRESQHRRSMLRRSLCRLRLAFASRLAMIIPALFLISTSLSFQTKPSRWQ